MSNFLLYLFLLSVSLLLLQFSHGWGVKCLNRIPAVKQIQVGYGKPPEFNVVVQNSCPMCPVIEVHIRCGSGFSQSLVDPRVVRVVGVDDCVVNGGLPLAPLHCVSFNYTHQRFRMGPKSWSFQCE